MGPCKPEAVHSPRTIVPSGYDVEDPLFSPNVFLNDRCLHKKLLILAGLWKRVENDSKWPEKMKGGDVKIDSAHQMTLGWLIGGWPRHFSGVRSHRGSLGRVTLPFQLHNQLSVCFWSMVDGSLIIVVCCSKKESMIELPGWAEVVWGPF